MTVTVESQTGDFTAAVSTTSTGSVPVTVERKPPTPRKIPLPLGGEALMYTRENLTWLFKCSHGELGRLLARSSRSNPLAPLPIRVDGQILWYCDECLAAAAQIERTLLRWRKR